jgi:hypothetical protein
MLSESVWPGLPAPTIPSIASAAQELPSGSAGLSRPRASNPDFVIENVGDLVSSAGMAKHHVPQKSRYLSVQSKRSLRSVVGRTISLPNFSNTIRGRIEEGVQSWHQCKHFGD